MCFFAVCLRLCITVVFSLRKLFPPLQRKSVGIKIHPLPEGNTIKLWTLRTNCTVNALFLWLHTPHNWPYLKISFTSTLSQISFSVKFRRLSLLNKQAHFKGLKCEGLKNNETSIITTILITSSNLQQCTFTVRKPLNSKLTLIHNKTDWYKQNTDFKKHHNTVKPIFKKRWPVKVFYATGISREDHPESRDSAEVIHKELQTTEELNLLLNTSSHKTLAS